MKRTLLFAAVSAALLFANTSNAQVPGVSKVTKLIPKVDLGIKVGANFQQLTGTLSDNAYKAGVVGGVFVGVHTEKIGVQAEGLIKTVKFSAASGSSGYINALYLDVPVLFEYKIVPRLWIQLGPQFSTMLSAKDNNSTDVKTMFKSSDISGVAGLQAVLPLHLVAGARYVMGFSDVNAHTVAGATETWNNRSIQVYVGFRFL